MPSPYREEKPLAYPQGRFRSKNRNGDFHVFSPPELDGMYGRNGREISTAIHAEFVDMYV
jgi:hypothetical protein